MNGIVVWLIENHPLAARSLQQLLKRRGNVEVLSGGEILVRKAAPGVQPSILVIDREGLPTPLVGYVRLIRTSFPQARILLLGNPLPTDDLCRLLFTGIHGFIPYAQIEDLDAAIQVVSQGHLWARPEVLEQFALSCSKFFHPNRACHQLFAAREELIIGLLQRRLSNKEIGCALGISERTVRFHMGNIFSKLGVHDRYSVAEAAHCEQPTIDPQSLPLRPS